MRYFQCINLAIIKCGYRLKTFIIVICFFFIDDQNQLVLYHVSEKI